MAEPTKADMELARYAWAAPNLADAAQLIAEAHAGERKANEERREALHRAVRMLSMAGDRLDSALHDPNETNPVAAQRGWRQARIESGKALMEKADAETPVDG